VGFEAQFFHPLDDVADLIIGCRLIENENHGVRWGSGRKGLIKPHNLADCLALRIGAKHFEPQRFFA
jgi:hypothetical protein